MIIAYSGAATADLMTLANEAGANIAVRKDFARINQVLDRLESGACPDAQELPTIASLDEVERTYLD